MIHPISPLSALSRRACLALLAAAGLSASTFAADEFHVYFGTFTRGNPPKSKGIYHSRLDAKTGTLSSPTLVMETASPSFLALHPTGKFLYAVGEIPNGGGVKSFAVDGASGKLTLLNEESSGGSGPTHLAVDASGRALIVANYTSGSVASLPIGEDGRLGPAASFFQHKGSSVNERRQAGPHAHCVNVSPDNRFAVSADLGMDKVLVYKLDAAKATLAVNDPPSVSLAPGSGPRHFAFHPNGRFAYVINEMVCTMTAFTWDSERGALTELHTVSTLPNGVAVGAGMSTAEVFVHPNGRFLYGSNRGHDTIAVYGVGADGRLQLIENAPAGVKVPRNFNLDPTGQWLLAAGQNSDDVAVHRVNSTTGRLTASGVKVSVGSPVCVVFLPVN